MDSTDLINYVLESIPKVKNINKYFDDGDISFLNDYFERSKVTFSLMDNLQRIGNNQDFEITENQFEDVTNSVRKISKKYRDAAKLLHILKKTHFRVFFNSLEELQNQKYVVEPYSGMLHEIDLSFDCTDHQNKLKNVYSDSETISGSSEISEESEEIINDTINLPAYQDIQLVISNNNDFYTDFQIIGLERDNKQPLGITVTKHDFDYCNEKLTRCIVERILVNSIVDKQGLLQVGDIIFDVNDESVDSPESLQYLLSKSTGTINFKIMKSSKRPMSHIVNLEKSFVKALFDYDPSKDKLIPSENIGLQFSCGDVFEILNRDDPNFWQAQPLNCSKGQALLVPSQSLQERRIALESDIKSNDNHGLNKILRRKSKKSELFRAQDAADIISEADLRTYEEVVKFPPSRVPCLLLLGPSGIGKKAIKHILVQKEPNRFAFPIQDTTEQKRGRNQPLFNHVDKTTMMNDIKACLYVCLEEKNGEMYGIKSSTIRELINQNKTVVLDCKPKDVYSLKLPQFNPYVILISAPSITIMEAMQKEGLQRNFTKMKRTATELQDIIEQSNNFLKVYKHLINFVLVNENFLNSIQTISSVVSEFENNDSWIPASWENDIIPLPIIPKQISRDSIKSPDNLSVGQMSLQRRFEKKSEKSALGNKLNIIGKSQDVSSSGNSSDTYSDSEIVKAKPIKYVSEEKKTENNISNNDNIIQVKPKPRVSVTRQIRTPVSKEESLLIKEESVNKFKGTPRVKESNNNNKSGININLNIDNTDYNEIEKQKTHQKVMPQRKEAINLQSQEKRKLQGKESIKQQVMPKPNEKDQNKTRNKETFKVQEREILKSEGRERPYSQEKEIIKNEEKELNKSDEKEIIKSHEKVISSHGASNNKIQIRSKVIKMKESSSSDMSDTTSEDESQGIKVNRV